jgi:hypothetical protein
MVASGDVELQRDGDAYWVDPLDLHDTGSLVTADVVLAAVMSSGSFRPGSGFSAASAATHVAPMPEPQPRETIRLTTEESWEIPGTLEGHARRHGPDFGTTDADEYAPLASAFLQQQGTLVKIDETGVIRVYDPPTNTFGAYNPRRARRRPSSSQIRPCTPSPATSTTGTRRREGRDEGVCVPRLWLRPTRRAAVGW